MTDRTADALTALLAQAAEDEQLVLYPTVVARVAHRLAELLDAAGYALVPREDE
jgi:hypothetical protein